MGSPVCRPYGSLQPQVFVGLALVHDSLGQFTVEFKPGHQNAAADTLSRQDEDAMAAMAISIPDFELFEEFTKESMELDEVV